MDNDFQVHIMKLSFIESTRTSKQEMRRALGDPSAWYKILTTRRNADIVIDRNLRDPGQGLRIRFETRIRADRNS